MKRYTCGVLLTFELDAMTAGDAIDAMKLMVQFIEQAVVIARGFRKVTSFIPPTEPNRVYPTEVSDG